MFWDGTGTASPSLVAGIVDVAILVVWVMFTRRASGKPPGPTLAKGGGRVKLMSPRHRKIQLAMLLAAVALVVCLTGQMVVSRGYPVWRERTLREAFDQRTGPARWWPASWRAEYERHVKLDEWR
jgi:hypothetical protein